MNKHLQTKLAETLTVSARNFTFRKLNDVNNPSSVHGIFPYRGKISAIDAQQVIHQLPQKGILLDPFCGSGTIVYEAQRWGLTSIGVDNNPIAYILSRAKTQPIDRAKTITHSQELIKKAKNLKSAEDMNDWPKKFFHQKTSQEIMSLYFYKNEMSDYELAAYYGAIALTARACNHYVWSSNSVGKLMQPLLYVDFYSKFQAKIKKHIKFVDGNVPAKIFKNDSRRLTEIIEAGSIDYVYTSPPYFNALDYTSYYTRIIYEIGKDFDRKEIRQSLIQTFSTYAEDMKKVLLEIKQITKKNAFVFFVVGDKKTPENEIINGGSFFSHLTSWEPLHIIEREYSGSSSQIWDSINKTKRKEQIVIWSNE
jgi:DNA modification methylase